MTKKINKYLLVTYMISWVMWGSLIILTHYDMVKYGEVLFMTLFIIGGNGPFLGALIIKKTRNKKEEFRRFVGRILKYKVNFLWYLWILIIPFILISIPWIINSLNESRSIPLLSREIYMIFPLALTNIILGGLEEVGWRGVLLPEFLSKYSNIKSTIFTSIIWTMWHIPLWFIKGTSQQNMEFISFLILGLGFSLLLTVVYTKTKSIFLCILLHSLINSYPNIINMSTTNFTRDSLIMLVYCVGISGQTHEYFSFLNP